MDGTRAFEPEAGRDGAAAPARTASGGHGLATPIAAPGPHSGAPARRPLPHSFAQRGIGFRLTLALAASTAIWATILWLLA